MTQEDMKHDDMKSEFMFHVCVFHE